VVPGGQRVVAFGGMVEFGMVEFGMVFGLVGLLGVVGLVGAVGLVAGGAAVAASAAAPNSNPDSVTDRYLMTCSLLIP
jgi:hypothetical protein